MEQLNDVGIVIIGRNEGERLRRCFSALRDFRIPIVYVDSGSSDQSVAHARDAGIDVIELDLSLPMSAARGRNTGFNYLLQKHSELKFIQFIDGDCELHQGWLTQATQALRADPSLAVVCGILHEKNRDSSVFRRLCDIDWSGPIGEIESCGGIAMIRVTSFTEVQGFKADMIAEEEAELCRRIRKAGGRVVRLVYDMAEHDSGMNSFSQWWYRAVRVGFAYAEAAALPDETKDLSKKRAIIANIIWAFAIPLSIITLYSMGAAYIKVLAILLLLLYPLQLFRIYSKSRRSGLDNNDAGLFSFFCMLAKWPELIGHIRYWLVSVSK